MSGEIEFELTQPLIYHDNGNANATTKVITMVAPSRKTKKHAIKIRQRMLRAFISSANLANKDKQSAKTIDDEDVSMEVTPNQMFMALNLSNEEYTEVMDYFEQLLHKIAYIQTASGNKIFLTDLMIDKIDSNSDTFDLGGDIESMLIKYCANFILPSLMKHLNQN